ncbi:class I SAM-dependent methyltransferase [Paenibacillus sp. J5C_2022]|uniref:class I SAM-dependent methyltransferase n=1 Tax=Paenibacillus sp. J5C2022 TaxID=2977129 RepID=UPI0021CECDF8|nr:class I SAM-dependent methyltransferase [Paenibacillus sp. J5C2022]MCU6710176.1 class I SAM-dependent methyltransferase [Paenibacillus sp. J5C2022]
MEKKSLTALVSAFARAYHAEQNEIMIFDDSLARQLLTDEEYESIAANMSQAIAFFRPDFAGTARQALREVVDYQLSPTPLGRAAFAEQSLETAVTLGAGQYLILAAGYDTFAYRQPQWARGLDIIEIDHAATAADKQKRMSARSFDTPSNLHHIAADFNLPEWQSRLRACPSFATDRLSFCSLLGISYYLDKEVFARLLSDLALLLPKGSSIVFDYPDEHTFTPQAGDRARKQVRMAAQAGEPMQACYSYLELEEMLEGANWLIYRHLTPIEITDELFQAYNESYSDHPITAFDNVNYCLAVRS